MKKLLLSWGTLLSLLIMVLVLHWMTPIFLTSENIKNILLQSSINALLAYGLTFVIITAGIDLSVGSILAFSGVILGQLLQSGTHPTLAILACLLVGAICGSINGVLVAKTKLPPFIATLGMMSIARGAALLTSNGRAVSGFSEQFVSISSSSFIGIPSPILIMITILLLSFFILKKTKWGREIYAVGGNPEASWLSGINVKWTLISVYIVSGILSSIGAVILTSRLNSAGPIAGIMYELDAIAATVIGGTSLTGGVGSVIGTLIGALIMGVLRNGLNLLDISSYLQQIIIGGVIILAVIIDRYKHSLLKDTKKTPSRLKTTISLLTTISLFTSLLFTIGKFRTSSDSIKPKIGLVLKSLNNPFFVEMQEAAVKQAKASGVELLVAAPNSETDVEKQMQIVENYIAMGVKVLLITPSGSKELVNSVLKANKANVPVIIIDTRIDETLATKMDAKTATFIGSDNYHGGKLAGQYAAKILNYKGNVSILEGIAGHETGDQRINGFKNEIAKHQGLKIIAAQPANFERSMGHDVFQNILQAHKTIDVLFAANDQMALGAIEASKHVQRKPLILGFDANKDALVEIQKGTMAGSIAQYPTEMGRLGVISAVSLIQGKTIEKYIPTKVELITKK
ncbi:substrate-binding domain-containing protein [Bacteriovoracaceae bacterium]|nr:substrate-binding domain-containing protein [Bacteriovoracaceae bacterium]